MQSPLIFYILFLPFASLNATTYYVSNVGSDTNLGTSLEQAFASLQHAADQILAGDSVVVSSGEYAGFDLRGLDGTAQAPIVFIAPDRNALIDGGGPLRNDGINIEGVDHVEINGFNVTGMIDGGNGIRIVLADHCIVRHCICDQNDERGIFSGFTDDILIEYNTCSNSVDEHGIYVSNSSDRPVIRYNTCFGNNNIGIHMNGDLSAGGDGIISNAVVYGNIIYDNNLAAGINMDGCQNPLVYNNLIYNNHFAQGIACFQEDGAIVTQGAKIYHNTIIVPEDGRWGILLRDGAHLNTDIKNNIIINQHSWRGCIATDGIDNLSSNHNILQDKMSNSGDGTSIPLADWQDLGFDSNSLLLESLSGLFRDHTAGDFSPAPSAQSIDAGTGNINADIEIDIRGLHRTQGSAPDIGAFESGLFQIMYQISLAEDVIEFDPTQPVSFLEILGSTELYSIKILTPAGEIFQEFANQPGPLIIDLSTLPSLDYLLQIENFSHPSLAITDDFN